MSPDRSRKLLTAFAGVALAVAAAAVYLLLRPPAYEITFFVASDPHYGLSPTVAGANERTVEGMNRLPGTALPEGLGGVVGEPRGVAVLGDLVDNAAAPDAAVAWHRFTADFGVDGHGLLRFPVYELPGNHDGGDEGIVRRGIRERDSLRPGLLAASADGISYAWDWGPVHFVSVGVYAGSEGDAVVNPWGRRSGGTWRLPGHSLEFLGEDLTRRVGASGRPVVLLQHYGWDAWGLGWWSDREREALRAAVKGYNVIAAFYGHSHVMMRVELDGYPAFCAGSTQSDPLPGSFLVVRIRPRVMDVAERKADGWGYLARVPIRGRASASH